MNSRNNNFVSIGSYKFYKSFSDGNNSSIGKSRDKNIFWINSRFENNICSSHPNNLSFSCSRSSNDHHSSIKSFYCFFLLCIELFIFSLKDFFLFHKF